MTNAIDLTDRAELGEVLAVLVDALRRADPAYCKSHGVEQITDADWDTALQAGEDALEALQTQPNPSGVDEPSDGATLALDSHLVDSVAALLALAKRYAGECGECAGTRVVPTVNPDGRFGPDEPCTECAFIWNVIDQVEGGKPVDAHEAGAASRVTEEMVTRFLGWRLPDTFAPDGGISFKPVERHPDWTHDTRPIGTNLFTATEARAMLEHVLGTLGPHVTPRPSNAPMLDLVAHLRRQSAWSERTFGPGPRTKGVCDHIRKELAEIEAEPCALAEWIDVVLLALDGAWRAGWSPEQIAAMLNNKQTINEGRKWPNWRTAAPDKAIEHDRTAEGHA